MATIQGTVSPDANLKMGNVYDESLGAGSASPSSRRIPRAPLARRAP